MAVKESVTGSVLFQIVAESVFSEAPGISYQHGCFGRLIKLIDETIINLLLGYHINYA